MYKTKIEQCQESGPGLGTEIGPADSEEDRNISFSRSGESRGNAIAVKFGVRLVEVTMDVDGEESNEEWRPAKSGGFRAQPGRSGTTT